MFHARTYLAQSDQNSFVNWLLSSGASGVDLFFCISGFVMVLTTRRPEQRHVIDFAIKRLARIVPPYLVLTIVFVITMKIVFYLIGTDMPNYNLEVKQVLKSLVFIPLRLSSPADAPMWGTATLHVGWTLDYEIYFYTVFAASLIFGRARWLVFFGWFVATLIALPLLARGQWSLDAYAFYGFRAGYLNLVTSPLIWEFVSGVLICFLYLSPLRFPSVTAAWLAVCLAGACAGVFIFNGYNPGVSGYTPGFGFPRWGFVYGVLLLVLVIADKSLRFRVPAVLTWLGSISFSLYLVHPIVIESTGILLLEWSGIRPMLTGLPYVLFLTSLSLVAAAFVNKWLEVGLSGWVRRHADRLLLGPGADPLAHAQRRLVS